MRNELQHGKQIKSEIDNEWKMMQPDEEQIHRQYQQQKIINNEKIVCIKEEYLKQSRYYSIGALTFKNTFKQQCVGSGFLISKNIVLTAAHNLFDRQQLTGHKFYLAAHGITNQYHQIQSCKYPPEYLKTKQIKYDYGIIKLKDNINMNEYPKLSVPCQKCIKKQDKKLSVYGYPQYGNNYYCKDGSGTNIQLYQYGLEKEDVIVKYQPSESKIGYTMSTWYGHSGSPIVVENQIIGIHVGSALASQTFNMGVLLTPEIINTLKRWCKQLKGDQFTINQQKCSLHSKLENKKQSNNEGVKPGQKLILGMSVPSPIKSVQIKTRLKTSSMFQNYPSIKSTRNIFQSSKNFLPSFRNIKNPQEKKVNLINTNNYAKIDVSTKPKLQIPNHYSGFIKKNIIQTNNKPQLIRISTDPLQKAKNIFEVGKKRHEQKKYQEALLNFKQCLLIQEQVKGKGCFQSAITYIWLGSSYYNLNKHSQAITNYQQSINIYQNKNKTNVKEYAIALGNLGNIYHQNKMYKIAIQIYDKAREAYQIIGNKASVEKYSQKIIDCMKNDKKMRKSQINMLKKSQQLNTDIKKTY